jgi:hypothetical protein
MLSQLLRRRFLKLCGEELSNRIDRKQFRPLAVEATRKHRELLSSQPREETFGAREVTEFVVLGIASFQGIEAAGVGRKEAIRIIARVNRRILEPLLSLATLFATLLGRRPIDRSRRIWAFLNRIFPFAPPAWKRVDVSNGPDAFGFDYGSCPIATITREHAALDLCSGAFCEVDYWIGDALKVHLDRKETLALGYARCRFRWHASDSAESRLRDVATQ